MRDKWTNYFDKNRVAMDSDRPDPELWDTIKKELLKGEEKRIVAYPWLKIAASTILIAGSTWFISSLFFKDSKNLNHYTAVLPVDTADNSAGITSVKVASQENSKLDSCGEEVIVEADSNTSTGIVLVDCLRVDSVAIVLGDDFQLSFSNSSSISSLGNSDGAATVTPSGGVVPYVYDWDFSGENANRSNVNTYGFSSGNYTVTLADVNSATTAVPFLMISPDAQAGVMGDAGVGYAPLISKDESILVFTSRREGKWLNPQEPGKINGYFQAGEYNTETYQGIVENEFKNALQIPLSTFSIDVDAASYSNVRRFINDHQKPPANAVKIEEMVNYFQYDYPQPPEGGAPFSINTEIAICPWNKDHHLVQIGLQGRRVEKQDLPNSNLVFLIDVSGSMSSIDKLELLKNAFKLLVRELREEDMVSIVVYAGAAGVVLEPTSGANKDRILDALMKLKSGGSTAGGQGIELAYNLAEKNFMNNGNNRVILATDGDFNVGLSDDDGLVKLIEEKRNSGIFLTVLGFGRGNYQDAKMEKLADNGNGNHAYIDGLMEAQKVFVNEMGATLLTIAKDVKIQVEFNPAQVKAYRLVGYENRLLANKDFANDAKDAGDMGAGHSVTAFYEVILVDGTTDGIPLKYQKYRIDEPGDYKDEIMTVKLRYKEPKESKSKLITRVLMGGNYDNPSNEFQFASSVAEFGMLLRGSKFKGTASYESILKRATGSKGGDEFGYRAEFIKLVKTASNRNYHN